jgi:hypothetical protein
VVRAGEEGRVGDHLLLGCLCRRDLLRVRHGVSAVGRTAPTT